MAPTATRHSHAWTRKTYDTFIDAAGRDTNRSTSMPSAHTCSHREEARYHASGLAFDRAHAYLAARTCQLTERCTVLPAVAHVVGSAAWHNGTRHEHTPREADGSRRQHHTRASIACLHASCPRLQAFALALAPQRSCNWRSSSHPLQMSIRVSLALAIALA